MKIEINVDELQFKELLDGELKNLPEEKIQEIIFEGIRNYMNTHPDVIKTLFVDSNSWRYSEQPTSYLKNLIAKDLHPETFKEIQGELIDTLKKNYDRILRDAFIELMISGIFDTYKFQDRIRETMYQIRQEEANRGY